MNRSSLDFIILGELRNSFSMKNLEIFFEFGVKLSKMNQITYKTR